MTLSLFLTFIAIIIASYGILNRVQKTTLNLFFPWKSFVVGMIVAFIFSLLHYLAAIFAWNIPLYWKDIFELITFIILIGVFIWGIVKYSEGRLELKKEDDFRNFLGVCLRENLFDEFIRIIQNRKNRKIINQFTIETIQMMFNSKFIGSLFRSYSWFPLELLSDKKFLERLKGYRHNMINAVIREMLRLQESPLHSVIFQKYGGQEFPYIFSETTYKLIKDTFQNPDWYYNISAHYPLVISAVEEINSGKLDVSYNSNGRLYETSQGISQRSRCVVYLSFKTHIMAIESAINSKSSDDFYISDLADIFLSVLGHSGYDIAIWDDKRVNFEHPTPFAFLMHEILNDFRELSKQCLDIAIDRDRKVVNSPGNIAGALANCWSLCVWNIAKEEGHVSKQFRETMVENYLFFVLQLGFGQSEIIGSAHSDFSLDTWRDLYIDKLIELFSSERSILSDEIERVLDIYISKDYVRNGKKWLIEKLRVKL